MTGTLFVTGFYYVVYGTHGALRFFKLEFHVNGPGTTPQPKNAVVVHKSTTFFTTATIFSSILYVDYDFHNILFMEVFVGRFSISSIYFDGTLTILKNYII